MAFQFIEKALSVILPLTFLFHDVAEGDVVNCTLIDSDKLCFYQYDDSGVLSWTDAILFCASKGATLPVITNANVHNELLKFLDVFGGQGTEIGGNAVWTAAHTVPVNISVKWHWINGQPSNINVTQNWDDYGAKWATAIELSGSHLLVVSQQDWTQSKAFICQYNNASSSCGGFVYNSRCYKLHSDSVNWFQAAANCVVNGGTMASFDDNVLTGSGFDPNWLSPNGVAWIGLLKPWWIWPDGSDIMYNKFSVFTSPPPMSSSIPNLCAKVRSSWEAVTCSNAERIVCQTDGQASVEPTTTTTTMATASRTRRPTSNESY